MEEHERAGQGRDSGLGDAGADERAGVRWRVGDSASGEVGSLEQVGDSGSGYAGADEGAGMNERAGVGGFGLTPGEAAEHLRVIRRLIERPVRMTTRSGLAAIVAGLLALGGAGASWLIMFWPEEAGLELRSRPLMPEEFVLLRIALVWLGVFVLAAAANVLIVSRRAGSQGHTWWRREQLQTAKVILPGFFLAAAGTWLLAGVSIVPIPFIWMIGYGMALWAVGTLSIAEVRVLGAAFLVCGWLGMFFLQHISVWMLPAILGVTFGAFHLVYGVTVYRRHGG